MLHLMHSLQNETNPRQASDCNVPSFSSDWLTTG
jgi:hypothetical protein